MKIINSENNNIETHNNNITLIQIMSIYIELSGIDELKTKSNDYSRIQV